MDPTKVAAPAIKQLTTDNITANVILANSRNPDARFKYLLERLVHHLHDFARETRLNSDEWMAAIQFLTKTGQTCTDVRQEFIILSDILGLSLLIDSIDHPKPAGATEGSVLGPFHTHDGLELDHGALMSQDQNGEPLLVLCTVKDTEGKPIAGAKVDIWETDSTGHYDVQHPDRTGPDGRGTMTSDENGEFWFKAIVPIPYPIPHDGPVGQLLLKLQRHPMRPSHMHFKFDRDGFDPLITSLYLRNDPYETSDAVFGVKESLLVGLGPVSDAQAQRYGISAPATTKLLTYDFVLVPRRESDALRVDRSRLALEKLGVSKVTFVGGLPVPDLD